MERISIKNVNFSEALSEETNAYTADVYFDNKKIGYAKNSGQGGETFIHPYEGKREQLREAEAYAATLPEIKVGKYTVKSDLPWVCDTLMEKSIHQKELKSKMRAAIIFETKDNKLMQLTFNQSIAAIRKTTTGLKLLQKHVDELKAEGSTILNTNLTGVKL